MKDDRIDVALTTGPIEYEPTQTPDFGGGECVFLGRSRAQRHEVHGALQLLRYEAYNDMARNVLEDLARRAVEEHEALLVRVVHSIGDVPVGRASVLVQVVCRHRAPAFAACRMIIDELKVSAPIWKNEVWERGTTWSDGQSQSPMGMKASDR